MSKNKLSNDVIVKPPIVVILGHVDHGKTLLLDYIRKSNKIAQESGGITQHVGAYQIDYLGKKITFIDTPGHEAFSAMRSRGAKVADIAILVIAAEEGLKPQTKEAIRHIKDANIPMIVAINKIDKPEAQPEKIKQQLSENEVFVEGRGGDVPCVNVSAKSGQGIDELLEIILLIAEISNFSAYSNKRAEGVIVESHLDSFRGPTVTLLVTDGILKKGDIILANSTVGSVKRLEDDNGKSVEEIMPGTPAIVIGLKEVPGVGESFSVEESLELAEEKLKTFQEKKRDEERALLDDHVEEDVFVEKKLNIILKVDAQGSLEALVQSLKNIKSEKVAPNFVLAGVGDVNNSDIKLAQSTGSQIFAFYVKSLSGVEDLARRSGIKIHKFNVIYDLIQKIKEEMINTLDLEIEKTVIGQLKILAVFKREKSRLIIGGKVLSGEIKRGGKIDVVRESEIVGSGKIVQLQQNKKETDSVEKGRECGIMIEGVVNVEEGDILEMFEEKKKAKEL